MGEEMLVREVGRIGRVGGRTFVTIGEPFRAALRGLEEFSHCHVLWWAGSDFGLGFDTREVLEGELPYAPGRSAGVFACRGPFRPNPIAITVCPVVAVDLGRGEVELRNIDALDGSAVLDLKPYYPSVDRLREARVPDWLPDWGEWAPEEGFALEV